MIPEKYRILMNNEIDGENSPAEREELRAYFRNHPDASQYFQDLKNSLEVLEEWRTEEVQPPPGLRDRIMRSVFRKQPTGRRDWGAYLFGRLRLGYALSVAVGIMTGLLLHTMIPVDGLSRNLTALDLYRGTSTTQEATLDGWAPSPAAVFEQDGVTAQVHAFRLDDKMLVRMNLRSPHNVSLGIRFAPEARLQGVLYSQNQGFNTATGPGSLQLDGNGTCHCEFLVDSLDDPGFDLVLSSPDQGTLVAKEIRWH